MEEDVTVIDYEQYRAELRRRLEALRDRARVAEPTKLTHKPRHPFKRRWLAERGLLTTPLEAPGEWRPKFRKPDSA